MFVFECSDAYITVIIISPMTFPTKFGGMVDDETQRSIDTLSSVFAFSGISFATRVLKTEYPNT